MMFSAGHGHRPDVLRRHRAAHALRDAAARHRAGGQPAGRRRPPWPRRCSTGRLHPWAIYAVVGLAIAYGVFRKGRSLLISSAFAPLLGEKRANGPAGTVIDIFAIFATLFGSATSLGLGALQIGSGLQIVAGIGKVGNGVLIAIIAVLTVCFILSAVSGVAKGIQWLSNINMVLALALAALRLRRRPDGLHPQPRPDRRSAPTSRTSPMMSARTDAAGGDGMKTWLAGWTIFYWAWWVSWTPVRRHVHRPHLARPHDPPVRLRRAARAVASSRSSGSPSSVAPASRSSRAAPTSPAPASPEGTLFAMLGNLPLADGDRRRRHAPRRDLLRLGRRRGVDRHGHALRAGHPRAVAARPSIFWGAATGAVAAVMLLIGGEDALSGLQNVTIVAALPFLVIMVGLAVALVKDLSHDPQVVRGAYAVAAVEHAVVAGVSEHGDDFSLTFEETAPGEGVGDLVPTGSCPRASGFCHIVSR